MVLLDQPLSPWFARSKVSELPLGQETSLVTSTYSCVPDDISPHLWVGLESRWDTISHFGSSYSLSGPTAVLPSLTRAPGSSAPLGHATHWGQWGRAKHGSCGTWVCQACNASAGSTQVLLPCAEHSKSKQTGVKPVSETRAWAHPTKQMLFSAIPLHDIQTYCLNKALCCSLKRGEEDKVYILIIRKCYLALLFQVPHQHTVSIH